MTPVNWKMNLPKREGKIPLKFRWWWIRPSATVDLGEFPNPELPRGPSSLHSMRVVFQADSAEALKTEYSSVFPLMILFIKVDGNNEGRGFQRLNQEL